MVTPKPDWGNHPYFDFKTAQLSEETFARLLLKIEKMTEKKQSIIFIDRLRKENQLAAIGDWCLSGRVEGAFLSAVKLVEHLKT